ncbi:uncharacterized protein LOC127856620 [Dreissena polymorpha]|uniref:uncharacterized protein LOC127856620 n=1 Tax=Dreissena polymorpha TaxID=45954 RepID=UPI00226442BF|nr:uncharacterized protein LOC127856620 [Dreissena polymorpha]
MGACILQGVFFGITNSHTPALMYEAAGHARYPQAMSLVNLMYGFGNVFSNIIGGVIRDTLGDYTLVFYIAAGAAVYMAFTSLAATCLIRRRGKAASIVKHVEESITYKKVDKLEYNTI